VTRENRRKFLKKLAKGAVYTAPAIVSMSAPVELVGRRVQATGKGHSCSSCPPPHHPHTVQQKAPWERPPP
jgi:hypothetical protein